MTQHTAASFKYEKISTQIDTLLIFPRHDRQKEPEIFINETMATTLDIKENTPDVKCSILKKFIEDQQTGLADIAIKVNRSSPKDIVFEDVTQDIYEIKNYNSILDHKTKNTQITKSIDEFLRASPTNDNSSGEENENDNHVAQIV